MAKIRQVLRRDRKRPIAGTIIVLLALGEILLRLYWVAYYLHQTKIWLNGFPVPFWKDGLPTPGGLDLATAAFRLIWLLVGIAVVIGLLRMKRWSWVILVFWVSLSLSVGILHFFNRSLSPFNPSDYAVMAADMVLVFAMNQSDVQRLYRIRKDDAEQIE